MQKEVQFQLISKLELDFEVGQEFWSSWHLRRSWGNEFSLAIIAKIQAITPEECTRVVNIFTCCIQSTLKWTLDI